MVNDVWSGESLGYHDISRSLKIDVPPMGVRFLRYNLVKISKQELGSESCYYNVVKPGLSGWLNVVN